MLPEHVVRGTPIGHAVERLGEMDVPTRVITLPKDLYARNSTGRSVNEDETNLGCIGEWPRQACPNKTNEDVCQQHTNTSMMTAAPSERSAAMTRQWATRESTAPGRAEH
eukprot:TRINITY_DN26188_c0_g2_i1.p1 TRINITY_DN26188_c0_g2~~TRINITY_DN26188_c0_g2_i1.p1  ORF type:complete len:110 (+),score=1.48 TRINITY_DN26188_c0_g2_i1:514-843(+)